MIANAALKEPEFRPIGSMVFLNESGDVQITWSEEHEASMRELIRKKLDDGYSFFIVEKKLFGMIEKRKKVTDISQIQKGTKLLLRDEDAVRLFGEGKVKVSKRDGDLEAGRRTKNIDEILKNDTLAVRPVAGG